MAVCNTTLTEGSIGESPLWKGFTFHHLGLLLSAAFGLVAVLISLFLILKHATHYSKPWEQRHIIRILFMIPIYATVSFLSYLYYKHAIYFEVFRDCYEAFAIASFFTLLCHYLEPTLHEQKNHFRQLRPRNWVLPLNWFQRCTGGAEKGTFRIPRSGLTWFNIIWIGVFQYCFIRVFFTVVSVLSQTAGRYCESSLNPVFAHVWVMCFEGGSVTIAMYCLIQFYVQLKSDLAKHSPFLKVLCIKLVIFFSFWQNILISFLSSSNGPLKPTAKLAYPDIKVGIPSTLLCIEMAIFAAMHLFAFTYRPYDISHPSDPSVHYKGAPRAFLDAFNPIDIVKACARGFRWLFVRRRTRHTDSSYQSTKQGALEMDVTFAGSDDAATGMVLGRQGSYAPVASEEDRAGLLAHAQSNPKALCRMDPLESTGELGVVSLLPAAAGASSRLQDDTGYHGADTSPLPRSAGTEAEWNAWGGAQRK